VIGAAVLYFNNKVSAVNGLGILLAIGGISLYNKAKFDHKKSGGGGSAGHRSLHHRSMSLPANLDTAIDINDKTIHV
jgi:hypothetical protein